MRWTALVVGTVVSVAGLGALPVPALAQDAAGNAAAAPQAPAAERLTVAEIAPPSSFLVLTIDDWSRARAAWPRSIYAKLWAEPTVQEFFKALLQEGAEEGGLGGLEALDKRLQDLGVDSIAELEPSGPIGVAVFVEPPAPGAAADGDDEDADTPRPEVHVVVLGDFGANADAVENALEKILDEESKKGAATIDEERYEGTLIRVRTQAKKDAEADDEDDFEMPSSGPWSEEAIKTIRFARIGSTLLMSSHKPTLTSAIDRLSGHGRAGAPSLAASDSYKAALEQHPRDTHLFAAFFLNDAIKSVFREGFASGMPLSDDAPDPDALFTSLGIFGVRSVSFGGRLDAEGVASEQTIGVHIPEKVGLITLFDGTMDRFEPPAYVGADAASLRMFSVRFDRILPIARAVLKSLPQEAQDEVAVPFAGFEGVAGPILAALAPEVSIASSYTRPFAADSQRTIVAIKLKDALALANQLTGFAAQTGWEPRDFQGNQIFESRGMIPSVGIGAGYAFVGQVQDIENALRIAAGDDAARLSASDRFKAATAHTPPGATFYSYDNTAETIGYALWQLENAEAMYKAQLQEYGLDEEDVADSLETFRENLPKWRSKVPPARVLLDYFGDNVFHLRPTPDGFRGKVIVLPGSGK